MSLSMMPVIAQQLPYQNPQLSAAQRADDLLKRLTIDEKVNLGTETAPVYWTKPSEESHP